MFDFLKKKLQAFIGTDEKKTKKASSKKEKKAKQPKVKKGKAPSSKKLKQIAETIQEEVPTKFQAGTMRYEPDQEAMQGEEEKKEGFFGKLFSKVSSKKITETDFDELFYELELALLESNVALDVVDKIKAELKPKLINKELKKEKLASEISTVLKNTIEHVLHEPTKSLIEQINSKQGSPFVILFFGINGSGKTTTIAKLAHYLKKNNISCVLAAGDTFRAASIEQLETHANRIGVPIVKSQYNADPASVAFDAIAYAKKHATKAVLIDTAGRMYTRENLMREMEKIVRVSKPDLKIFIGESTTGNDATEQARAFNETAGIDGIILSKADVDDKGGAALSVSHVTGKPIYFIGTGQTYNDLTPFKKSIILNNLGLD